MMKALRLAIGAAALLGGLAIGAPQAFAASATGSTNLSFTIPVTISFSGLAASYGGSGAAGSTTAVDMPGLSITTNNAAGWTLSVASGAAVFQGSGSHSFPSSADGVHIAQDTGCPTGLSCLAEASLGTTNQAIASTAAAGSSTFTVRNQITPPANQVPDTYSIVVNFLAATN